MFVLIKTRFLGGSMIFRTSYGELGHCLTCCYNFNSEQLWEQNIEFCPNCGQPLYLENNPEHYIPEDTELMNKKRDAEYLRIQTELKHRKKVFYVRQ
jgi:hypothetical protein